MSQAMKDVFVLPTSFAQQRLWFVDQLDPNNPLYNILEAIRLSGPISVRALEQAIETIVARHEVLRTTFANVQGSPVQVIAPTVNVTLPVMDLTGLAEGEREGEALRLATEEARRPFDLSRGPLFRPGLLRLGDE